MSRQEPPRLARKFLLWFLKERLAEEVEGDLYQKFEQTRTHRSLLRARVNYWYQVLHYVRPFALRKTFSAHPMNPALLQNYFKVGIRNIFKYKAFSFINIFGLAVALSIGMLIILMLADQSRYDRFHENRDHVYRILTSTPQGRQPYATSPVPLAQDLKVNFPLIREATTLTPAIGGEALYGRQVAEVRGYFAEPAFFSIFSFQLEKGNEKTALVLPNTMVLSARTAHQLFGYDDPIGKVVDFSDRGLSFPLIYDENSNSSTPWGSFTITGVIDDSRYKSHLRFDALVSASTVPLLIASGKLNDSQHDWNNYFRSYTYVLLPPNQKAADLASALSHLVQRVYKGNTAEVVAGIQFNPQRLTDIQLGLMSNDTNNRMPIEGYYFLGLLAGVILLSAAFNYTSLSIARALTRAKEIGIRKVTGALKRSIALQFLSESILISLIAMVMAIGILLLIGPAFKGLWINQFLEFELPHQPAVYGAFIAFALIIGLIAGIYPALHLSGYEPVRVLKGLFSSGRSRLGMRKVLSVGQFVVSLFFIITAILIFRQFNHFTHFDYGFRYNGVISVPLQGASYAQVSQEFGQVKGVTLVAGTDILPATGTNNGMQIRKSGSAGEYENANIILANTEFLDALHITMKAGRPMPDDTSNLVLVNEATVRKMGYESAADAVGELLDIKWQNQPARIAGVIQDFHHIMLVNGRELGPLIIRNQPASFRYALVTFSGPPQTALERLKEKWQRIDPVHPFRYRFYDEQLAATHQGVRDLATVLGFVAFLAIVIACLGLLGMATYTAERRTREVGVRKVLGASTWSIALTLSREFAWILLIAVAIGAPLSLFVNNLWLLKLATRVEFGWGTVLSGSLLLLTMGLTIIASQTLRVSRTNPVNSLKSE